MQVLKSTINLILSKLMDVYTYLAESQDPLSHKVLSNIYFKINGINYAMLTKSLKQWFLKQTQMVNILISIAVIILTLALKFI